MLMHTVAWSAVRGKGGRDETLSLTELMATKRRRWAEPIPSALWARAWGIAPFPTSIELAGEP